MLPLVQDRDDVVGLGELVELFALVDQPERLRGVGVRAHVVGVAGRRTKMLEGLLLALLDDDPAHPRVVGLRRAIVGGMMVIGHGRPPVVNTRGRRIRPI